MYFFLHLKVFKIPIKSTVFCFCFLPWCCLYLGLFAEILASKYASCHFQNVYTFLGVAEFRAQYTNYKDYSFQTIPKKIILKGIDRTWLKLYIFVYKLCFALHSYRQKSITLRCWLIKNTACPLKSVRISCLCTVGKIEGVCNVTNSWSDRFSVTAVPTYIHISLSFSHPLNNDRPCWYNKLNATYIFNN